MRPDSYSETSQVNSSCLDASYEHARACSTQSPKRILPLSYFILQPERGYKSEGNGESVHHFEDGKTMGWALEKRRKNTIFF